MIRQKTLEIAKGSIKNEQSREIGNKKQSEDKQNKYTPRYVLDTTIRQTNTNHVHKTRSFLQTIGGKDEPNIVLSVVFRFTASDYTFANSHFSYHKLLQLDWTFSVLLPKLFCLFLICHY
jgi:hypothetical protein